MGTLTRGVIVSEGLNLAGNTGLTARANVWLNAWLADTYASWDWPWLIGRYGPFNVASGAPTFTFGDGVNTADKILRINRAGWADTAVDGFRGWVTVSGRGTFDPMADPAWLGASNTGLTNLGLIEPSPTNPFQWVINFSPLPD